MKVTVTAAPGEAVSGMSWTLTWNDPASGLPPAPEIFPTPANVEPPNPHPCPKCGCTRKTRYSMGDGGYWKCCDCGQEWDKEPTIRVEEIKLTPEQKERLTINRLPACNPHSARKKPKWRPVNPGVIMDDVAWRSIEEALRSAFNAGIETAEGKRET